MKWNDIRIGRKMMLGFGSVLALLLAVVFVSLSGFRVILASSKGVTESEEVSAELLQREVDHLKWAQEVERYASSGDATRPLTVQLDHTQCGFGKWYYGDGRKEAERRLPDFGRALREIEEPHRKLHASAGEIKEAVAAGRPGQGRLILEERTLGHLREVQGYLRQMAETARQSVNRSESEMERDVARTRTMMLAFSLGALATGSLLGWVITQSTTRPLEQGVAFAAAVAEGDLTQEIAVDRKDQIGRLLVAMQRMLANLRELQGRTSAAFLQLEKSVDDVTTFAGELQAGSGRQSHAIEEISVIISQMNEQAGNVSHSMQNLSRISEETSSSTLEMIASIEQVAQNTEALFSSVNATSASMEQILDANKNVAQSADSLNQLIGTTTSAITEIDASLKEVQSLAQDSRQLSEEAQESAARDGGVAVSEAIGEIEQIRQAVFNLSGSMRSFAGNVDNIGEILAVIDDVAEQTNLLALNAAIIAAQAGEHGRGFAVVADEIRQLAERTSSSTKEIATVIAGIQQEKLTVGALVEESVSRVDAGVQAVGRTDQALRKIVGSTERAAAMSTRIASATAEQALGSREVARSIQQVSSRSREISSASADQARNGATVQRAIETMREMARQVRGATVEQTAGARLIAKASENTTLLAQQVTLESEESQKLSERSVLEVAAVQAAAKETLGVASRMRAIVENFSVLSGHLKQTLSQFRT